LHHYRRPSDVRPREERRPTVNEIAQQKHVLQKVNGWKVYHLTSQMEDLAELEKSVCTYIYIYNCKYKEILKIKLREKKQNKTKTFLYFQGAREIKGYFDNVGIPTN
jgi:hypothetical protein